MSASTTRCAHFVVAYTPYYGTYVHIHMHMRHVRPVGVSVYLWRGRFDIVRNDLLNGPLFFCHSKRFSHENHARFDAPHTHTNTTTELLMNIARMAFGSIFLSLHQACLTITLRRYDTQRRIGIRNRCVWLLLRTVR